MWFLLFYMSFKRKLIFLLLCSVTAAVAPVAYYVYEETKEILVQETQEKAIDIAVTISAFLTDEISKYRALSEAESLLAGSELEAYYLSRNTIFQEIKNHTDVAFVFTGAYVDEKTNRYILDGEDPTSEFFSPFGSTDPLNPLEREVYLTGKPVASEIEEDPIWGEYLTGYSAIIDHRDNTLVGWVGVDYDAASIRSRYARVSWILGICFALFIVTTSAVLYFIILYIHDRIHSDYLTKLENSRSFSRYLAHLIKQKIPFFLFMLDVDKFKAINDTYGHRVGDIVLSQIAKRLDETTQLAGKCFRYGGDEFTILYPTSSLAKAELLKEEIQAEVETITVPELRGTHLAISVGLAAWQEDMSAEELLRKADKELYRDKKR